VQSDLELGILMERLQANLRVCEKGLQWQYENELHKSSTMFGASLEIKLATNETANENDIIHDEIERLNQFVNKYDEIVRGSLEEMAASRVRFNRMLVAHREVNKRHRSIVYFRDSKHGRKTFTNVPLEVRQDWLSRLIAARKLVEGTPKQQELKYNEMRSICREFLETATRYAVLVVLEHNQPKYRKTLPIASEHVVHGRQRECGRGHDGGFWYTYETQGSIIMTS
jgi:hypothetical protein